MTNLARSRIVKAILTALAILTIVTGAPGQSDWPTTKAPPGQGKRGTTTTYPLPK